MRSLNYNSKMEQAPIHNTEWKVALYIRVANPNDDNGENDSVSSQWEILEKYIELHPELKLYDIYVDNGWSGTNFSRPDFQRMMRDITDGKVNCIIVKDLSRFSRDYMGSEIYINDILPNNKVRFIAVNNCVDTINTVV